MIKNVLTFDIGLSYAYSVIAIPALTGADPEHNPNEKLRITDEQASLLGNQKFRLFSIRIKFF